MSDPTPKTRGCHWISIPGVADNRGQVNFLEFSEHLTFAPKRLFWLHHIAPGQWRGRHGHRESHLVTLLMNGGCQIILDDGREKETLVLDDPSKALHIGPFVWHELRDFAPQSVVLVVASTSYDESEYLRDYDGFLREAALRTP